MGWYLRKSLSFGPLRLNLSKSGIGYSVGVKGARIGSGPRGNYIHLGRGGVYYRQSLGTRPSQPYTQVPSQPIEPEITGTKIVTADVSRLTDSSADQLLNYMREQHGKLK
jgi:Protein of unknown function (DUF4236)